MDLRTVTEKYEPVIGLEIHCQLNTQSKLFCGCSTKFGNTPNANTCPVCTGHPGVLPVLNERAVESAIKVGLALKCQIQEVSQFARKNYFYPDLPKAYQISMYELPIAIKGYLTIATESGEKKVGITRVHMEEDAGKLVHVGSERLGGSTGSLVDLNRSCVPLLEIVSEPDIRSPEEARNYVQELRAILVHLRVSDGNMEEGSLRCDANVSLRKRGDTTLGTRAEIKNMNSIRSIQHAIASEILRQAEMLDRGERIVQETRHFDDATGTTIPMRSKEEAHDYRYFPDPDLVPLHVSADWQKKVQESIGELPRERQKRYVEKLQLSNADAAALCNEPTLTDFYEKSLALQNNPREIAKWLLGDISGYLNTQKMRIDETRITPAHLVEMIEAIASGKITGKIGKSIVTKILETGRSPNALISEEGLTPIAGESELTSIIAQVVSENPKSVQDYRAGKATAITFLIGQTMKATRGRANPEKAREFLEKALKN